MTQTRAVACEKLAEGIAFRLFVRVTLLALVSGGGVSAPASPNYLQPHTRGVVTMAKASKGSNGKSAMNGAAAARIQAATAKANGGKVATGDFAAHAQRAAAANITAGKK